MHKVVPIGTINTEINSDQNDPEFNNIMSGVPEQYGGQWYVSDLGIAGGPASNSHPESNGRRHH